MSRLNSIKYRIDQGDYDHAAIDLKWAADEIERLQNELSAATSIADRDEAREVLSLANEGPVLDDSLWAEMKRQRDREKKARIYYQDMVYYACGMLDGMLGGYTVCGTLETKEGSDFKQRCREATAGIAKVRTDVIELKEHLAARAEKEAT